MSAVFTRCLPQNDRPLPRASAPLATSRICPTSIWRKMQMKALLNNLPCATVDVKAETPASKRILRVLDIVATPALRHSRIELPVGLCGLSDKLFVPHTVMATEFNSHPVDMLETTHTSSFIDFNNMMKRSGEWSHCNRPYPLRAACNQDSRFTLHASRCTEANVLLRNVRRKLSIQPSRLCSLQIFQCPMIACGKIASSKAVRRI